MPFKRVIDHPLTLQDAYSSIKYVNFHIKCKKQYSRVHLGPLASTCALLWWMACLDSKFNYCGLSIIKVCLVFHCIFWIRLKHNCVHLDGHLGKFGRSKCLVTIFFVIHPLHLNIDLAAIVSPPILQNQLALCTFCAVGGLDDHKKTLVISTL